MDVQNESSSGASMQTRSGNNKYVATDYENENFHYIFAVALCIFNLELFALPIHHF